MFVTFRGDRPSQTARRHCLQMIKPTQLEWHNTRVSIPTTPIETGVPISGLYLSCTCGTDTHQNCSKAHGVFPVLSRVTCTSQVPVPFTESLVETVPKFITPFVRVGTYRQGISLPRDRYSYGLFTGLHYTCVTAKHSS